MLEDMWEDKNYKQYNIQAYRSVGWRTVNVSEHLQKGEKCTPLEINKFRCLGILCARL